MFPIYDGQSSVSLAMRGSGQISGAGCEINYSAAAGDATQAGNTTHYYHGDHLGSGRLMTAGGGWPVWQAAFKRESGRHAAIHGSTDMSLTTEMMTVRFVFVFLFMASCGVICTWLFHIMRIEVNEKVPPEKKFGALFGYPGLLSKVERLHRQLYPRSHLRKVLNGFIALGLLCVVVMAWLVR